MKHSLRNCIKRLQVRVRQRVPAGVRLVLGFWMIPLGIAVAALDVVPLWRWVKGRRLKK